MSAHTGGCTCGEVRYRLQCDPIVVHCCHCHWCQRESGAAFALNAVIETERLDLVAGTAQRLELPSASGKGQAVFLCPTCKVVLWSHYGGAGERAAFVRVGTLDDSHAFPPDVHVFVASKQPWVRIPEGSEAFAAFYAGKDVVRIYGEADALRWRAVMGR